MVPTLQLPLKPWPNPALVLQVLMDVYPVHPPVLQDLLDVYPVPPPVILDSLAVYPVPRLVFQVPLDVYPVSCPVVEKMGIGEPCCNDKLGGAGGYVEPEDGALQELLNYFVLFVFP